MVTGGWPSMAAEDAKLEATMAAQDAMWESMVAEDVKMQAGPDVQVARTRTIPDSATNHKAPSWFNMAAEDAKTRITTQVSRGEMAANVHLISSGMTPPTNAVFVNPNVFEWKFNTSADVLEYVHSQQNRGIPVLITKPESLNREVDILDTEDLPWDQMLMACHLIDDITCHVPFRSQVFTKTHVRFTDTHEEDHLIFTQHKVHPLCVENCEYMHHVSEVLLMKYPLNVTQMLLV